MYLRDLIASLRRRWYLVVLAAVIAVMAGAAVFSAVKPTYDSTASVALVPPAAADEPGNNRFLNLASATPTVNLLSNSLASGATAEELLALAPGATFTVSPDPATSAPVLLLTASSTGQQPTEKMLDALLDRVPANLRSLQDEVDVPSGSQITSVLLASDETPVVSQKSRVRAAAAAAVVLGGLGLFLIALLDGVLVRRSARASGGRGGSRRRPRPPAQAEGVDRGPSGSDRSASTPPSPAPARPTTPPIRPPQRQR